MTSTVHHQWKRNYYNYYQEIKYWVDGCMYA